MADVLLNADQVNAGTTETMQLNVGGLDSFRVFNFSPYYLILHDTQAYDHNRYYNGLLDMIEPWSIWPVKNCGFPNKVYMTMDTAFSPRFTNEPTLTSLTSVTWQQSMKALPSYAPVRLLQASNLTVTSESGSVGSTTLPPVNVGNTASSPVQNLPVTGSGTSSNSVALTSQAPSAQVLASGGVILSLTISAYNQSTSVATDAGTVIYIYHGADKGITSYPIGNLAANGGGQMPVTITFGNGLDNDGIYFDTFNYPTNMNVAAFAFAALA